MISNIDPIWTLSAVPFAEPLVAAGDLHHSTAFGIVKQAGRGAVETTREKVGS